MVIQSNIYLFMLYFKYLSINKSNSNVLNLYEKLSMLEVRRVFPHLEDHMKQLIKET